MQPNPLSPRAHTRAPSPPKQRTPLAAVQNDPAVVDAAGHWITDQIAWVASMIVHTALILLLALLTFSSKVSPPNVILANRSDDDWMYDWVPPEPIIPSHVKLQVKPDDSDEKVIFPGLTSAENTVEHLIKGLRGDATIVCEWPDTSVGPESDSIGVIGCERGPGAFDGRFCRSPRPDGHGPTRASETAVDAALRWLAEHQSADGSWSFDHRDGLCQGRCRDPGSMKAAKNAATAMALMTFLGAGHSHVEGRYRENVARGLKFLLATLKQKDRVGSWHEAVGNATNYSHGMACLAVCEAYGMARDHKPRKTPPKSPSEMTEEERKAWKEKQKQPKQPETAVSLSELRAAAQSSLNYITQNQHPAGGWRYNAGQPGDTSVAGWMLMALKSGHMASLKVSPQTVLATSKFLDTVKHDDYGSIYHYLPDKNRPLEACKATTAIGLLCRMYMGWDRNHPGIAQGVQQLATWGPELSANGRAANMYYNYYATQVMFHHGGEPWKKWNNSLRDRLVAAQSKEGHARGSWHFTLDHGEASGGRLYGTTLAAMTLEVYYRYMPIYKSKSVEDRID